MRIGYVSGDCGTIRSNFLAGTLVAHDRAEVEIFCYFNRLREDDMSGHLREHANHWRNITTLSDAGAEALDTQGRDRYFDRSFGAHRKKSAAFIRAPSCAGAGFVARLFRHDWIEQHGLRAGHEYVVPENDAQYFVETVCRLPGSYLSHLLIPPRLRVSARQRNGTGKHVQRRRIQGYDSNCLESNRHHRFRLRADQLFIPQASAG